LLANKYGPAHTAAIVAIKQIYSNLPLPGLSLNYPPTLPVVVSYLLLTPYYLLLTPYYSGGEYRIRTDDPLLAKQVL
jgi:hypothetical protein